MTVIQKLEIRVTEMHGDIKYIKKALAGNGEQGLISECKENSEFRIGSQANDKLIKFLVGGGWLITILVLVFQFIV